MGLEVLFENKDSYHEKNSRMLYPVNNGYVHDSHRSSHEHTESIDWINILQKIRDNKKLNLLVILSAFLVLTILIVVVIVLLPIIIKLIMTIGYD
jgi:hypothetical protein